MVEDPGARERNRGDPQIEDEAPPTSFGAVLRSHRLASGLTQEALAERAGLGARGIQDLERGLHQPHRQTVQRLVRAFGLSGEGRQQFEALAGAGPRRRQPDSPIRRFIPHIVRRTETERPNIPIQPNALIGREREVAIVVAMLRESTHRLVTLTGPGGVGKTRLALQTSVDCADDFADGGFFVSFASLTDPALVVSTVAKSLGLHEALDRSPFDSVCDAIGVRRLLLVLDNFEPVVEAAPVVADLLAACPGLKVLVTSRIVLQVQGEHAYDVGPLAVPDLRSSSSPDRLTEYAAVRLFVDRAAAVRGNFALTDENARAVAEICARVEGLPLAIELAAARTRLLSPPTILARSYPLLPLLTGGARDNPARQRTMSDTIAWSYDLLDDGEKTLFRRLSAFVGGCTVDAALSVGAAGDVGEIELLNRLESLVEESLLQREDVGGESRLRMLETIREYGAERLAESGEEEEIRRRHVAFFVRLAERAATELDRAEEKTWLARLQIEHENLRTALQDCLSRDAETGLRLAGSLWRFWIDRGYLTEGHHWLESLLERASESGAARGKALLGLGWVSYHQEDLSTTTSALEGSLPFLRARPEKRDLGLALNLLGFVIHIQGAHEHARELLQESTVLYHETGDVLVGAGALCYLGLMARREGNHGRAKELLQESLALCREDGIRRLMNFVLRHLGDLARLEGDYQRARVLLEESLGLAWNIGHRPGVKGALNNLGKLEQAEGNDRRAVCLMAAAARDSLGPFLYPQEGDDRDVSLAAGRASLGDDAFLQAWAEGQAMTLEQAVAFALTPGATVTAVEDGRTFA